jgi:hypothetical protein
MSVYFIRPVGLRGPIKIGHSRSPECRRDALAAWSPFALELVATMAGGEDLERRFHALFEAQHARSEWFEWSEELQAVIDQVAAGTFDTSTLPDPVCLHARATKERKQATWTPERRMIHSYQSRVSRRVRRSGVPCKANPLFAGDPAVRAELDAYLAATD